MLTLYVYVCIVGLANYVFKIIIIAGISHLMLTPVWIFYFILAKVFGEKDKNIYNLLKRLMCKYLFLLVYFILVITFLT